MGKINFILNFFKFILKNHKNSFHISLIKLAWVFWVHANKLQAQALQILHALSHALSIEHRRSMVRVSQSRVKKAGDLAKQKQADHNKSALQVDSGLSLCCLLNI